MIILLLFFTLPYGTFCKKLILTLLLTYMNFHQTIYLSLISLLFSCQLNKPYIAPQARKAVQKSANPPVFSLYLIGDAGKAAENEPTLQTLQELLTKETPQSAVVFLGDNIYPAGLPDSTSADYTTAATHLLRQLATVKNYGGKPFFIAGNHDWNMSRVAGQAAVRRQEKFVENYLNKGNTFLPDTACAGVASVSLTDSLLLLALDTEWWFHEFEKPQGEKCNCTSRSKEELLTNLQTIIAENRHKKIVVVGHHPLYSNSAYFTWKSHLFPLTDFNPRWVVPLPILGTLYVWSRRLGVSRHDFAHKNYKDFRKRMLQMFATTPLVYAAGHDHNLQLHHRQQQYFVVSGSGSKLRHVAKRHKALFTVSQKGFAVLRLYDNGKMWVEYVAGENGKVLFEYPLQW